MTPAYLNPSPLPLSFVELKDDHQQLQFVNPQFQASSSLSTPIFFDITQVQRESHSRESQPNDQEIDKYVLHGGSSDLPNSNNYILPNELEDDDQDGNLTRMNGSTKWMSSKMRLMKKMMSNSYKGTNKQAMIVQKFDDHNQNNGDHNDSPNDNNNSTIRVCSNCNTTKTPLWRSGPQGPKSLCNACGIRQRKARRAIAANAMALNGSVLGSDTSPTSTTLALNGSVLGSDTSPTSTKVQNKEKKSRSSYIAQIKKPFKLTGPSQSEKKLSFDDFALSLSKNISNFQRAFPKDEEEAAILLMALSCGLIHN